MFNMMSARVARCCAAALLLSCFGLVPATARAEWSATLLPANSIAGAPGATVGWGYQLRNDDPLRWLMLVGLSSDPVEFATPLALFDLPLLAPGELRTTPFDGMRGLYALTWDPDTPAGFVNAGEFILTAEWWSGDPGAGGQFLESAGDLFIPYSATLEAGPVAVPEPGTALILLTGLALLGGGSAARRLRVRRSGCRPGCCTHR